MSLEGGGLRSHQPARMGRTHLLDSAAHLEKSYVNQLGHHALETSTIVELDAVQCGSPP
jgi:hypothetical protein